MVPPTSQAPEITITPPVNRAPRAVGAVPTQTLEQGGSTHNVDVAPYFNDPDGIPLTYTAESGDPGIVRAAMSGSTVTLTPVSDGTATIMVIAGDGNTEAVQSIAVMVRERQRGSSPVGNTRPSNPPPVRSPPSEPEPQLQPGTRGPHITGFSVSVQRTRGRSFLIFFEIEPEDAWFPGFSWDSSPADSGVLDANNLFSHGYAHFLCGFGFSGSTELTFAVRSNFVVYTDSITLTCT